MSSTIWNEQIYDGFLKLLKENVKVRNAQGGYEAVENVTVRKPELALSSDTLPAVTIQNYHIGRAVVNQIGKVPTYENLNSDKGTVEYTKQPVKFWLYFQVDFWAEYQQDIDDMVLTWLSVAPDVGGALKVVDTGGEEQTVSCSLVNEKVLDGTDTDKRLFRRTFSYKVSGRVDESVPEIHKYVTGVDITIK